MIIQSKVLMKISKKFNKYEEDCKLLIMNKNTSTSFNSIVSNGIRELKLAKNVNKSSNSDMELRNHLIHEIINTESDEISKEVSQRNEKIQNEFVLTTELEDMINSSTTELDPINDIEEDTAIEDIVWWEELGLLQDPFPATNGLENIKKEDYDKILVDNDGIKFAKNFKNNNKFDLGSHYLLMGDYGTGKSTVIDYMLDSCEDNEVCAFKLPLLTRTTEMEVRMSFLRLLSRRIERKLKTSMWNYHSKQMKTTFLMA